MKSNNNNEAITHVAMPERQAPILIDAKHASQVFLPPGNAEGYVSLDAGAQAIEVRRVQPKAIIDALKNQKQRQQFQKEYGTAWNGLLELLALVERMNAGDWSPILATDLADAMKPISAILDLSPAGWFVEQNKSGTGKLSFRSASDNRRLTIDIGQPSISPVKDEAQVHKAASRLHPVAKHGGKTTKWNFELHVVGKTAACALSEAFTKGMGRARFVVWWYSVTKRFVTGLYCPDMMTALYASVLSAIGTSGGIGVCQNQKCGTPFIRSRSKQLYCSHRCQVAAGMKRYRENLEKEAKSKSKTATKSKHRRGRK